MLLIIGFLDFPATVGFLNGISHGIRHHVCIHDNVSFAVSGSTANGLDQGSLRTKEALLVCIQNSNQSNLRNIKSFSQKVNAYKHIKYIQTHVADDFCTFQGINIRMKITDTDSHIFHILGKILGHSFGESCDQHFVFPGGFFCYFRNQVVYLSLYRAHLHLRIQKTGRTDDLLGAEKLMVVFIISRGSRYKQNLVQFILKFFKTQRAVILGRGQTETIVYQCLFTVLVASIHSANLWDCLVRLINNKKKIIPEIIQQSIRWLPWLQSGKMTGIVLNTGAKAGFFHHFNIKVGTLGDTLGFQKLVFAFKVVYPFF